MHIHIYMYIYICIHIHIFIYIYIYVNIFTHVYIRTYIGLQQPIQPRTTRGKGAGGCGYVCEGDTHKQPPRRQLSLHFPYLFVYFHVHSA